MRVKFLGYAQVDPEREKEMRSPNSTFMVSFSASSTRIAAGRHIKEILFVDRMQSY